MARKTVVRKLAKYLPLSIEFQKAAALDEYADAGLSTLEAAGLPEIESIAEAIPSLANEDVERTFLSNETIKGLSRDMLMQYLADVSAGNSCKPVDVMAYALKDINAFKMAFARWVPKNLNKIQAPQGTKPLEKPGKDRASQKTGTTARAKLYQSLRQSR